MKTTDFDFHLPPHLVAQQPAEPRDASRLMVLRRTVQEMEHHHFRDLPSLLQQGDLLVLNDTRVMAARLLGRREDTGGAVEALLVRPFSDTLWEVLFRPARRALPGRRFLFGTPSGEVGATVTSHDGDTLRLAFDSPIDPATAGTVPLPPYITSYRGDPERYQTIYSRDPRSAAAPTAGLHFTPGLLHSLEERGIDHAFVTLEVGPGTFKPVTADDPRDHVLHEEHITMPAATAAAIQCARAEARRIVAVGTTVVRTLEHVARERGLVEPYEGWTSLKMLPGDQFLVVDALITNFHLPRSTLLMLVCAFAGTEFALRAYRAAIEREYRFYSFGDAMLILP